MLQQKRTKLNKRKQKATAEYEYEYEMKTAPRNNADRSKLIQKTFQNDRNVQTIKLKKRHYVCKVTNMIKSIHIYAHKIVHSFLLSYNLMGKKVSTKINPEMPHTETEREERNGKVFMKYCHPMFYGSRINDDNAIT